ncbi:dehydrogenase-like protein [Salmonella enterica subsp. arizonae]|uniref:Dehydrogenase-like protein n=1 Tax=Salmonella enterica subsp. arizonae TaxID=59203 RepID=A0A2X4TE49_SALER|nr:dehydrogenase-like protein [Salmonella enterica subsp. arizonae]
MDGAIAYGKPGKRTPMWLSSIMKLEMQYLHDVINGLEPGEEFAKLLTEKRRQMLLLPLMLRRFPQTRGAKLNSPEILG